MNQPASGVGPSRWTDESLRQARLVGDPLADTLITHVIEEDERKSVDTLWQQLLRNDEIPTEGVCPQLVEYLKTSGALPSWLDKEKVAIGEAVFMRDGPSALASLLCASLPECYVMKHGVQVLSATQELEAHTHRRLFETAQMVVAVMSPGGLAEAGHGIVAAQKVRLMHATIRHLILEAPATAKERQNVTNRGLQHVLQGMRWDTPTLGYPINQEDMAYTLLTFSYVIPRAMMTFGIKLTEVERDAYLHCWNIVGHVMGVDPAFMPVTYSEAAQLFEQIKVRSGGASKEGKALTAALITCIEGVLKDTFIMKRLPHTVIRQLVGKPTADMLGVPDHGMLEEGAIALLELIEEMGAETWHGLTALHGVQIGTALVEALTELPRGGKRHLFALPTHLSEAWKIKPRQDRDSARS